MATKLVDSTVLDNGLTSIANAIRTKGSTSEQLAFPNDFVSAIQNLPSGGGGGGDYNKLKKVIDNSATSFEMPAEITSIGAYKLYNCTNLTNVDLTNCINIGDYAFYGCINVSNNNFTIPATVATIGDYAFYSLGSNNNNFTFIYNGNNSSIGEYSFANSQINQLSGTFTHIGSNAFNNCNNLTNINITVNGDIGGSAFRDNNAITILSVKVNGTIDGSAFNGLNTLNNFSLDPTSNITTLGTYTFNQLGNQRSEPENNIWTLDFRNSTFTELPQNCFSGTTSYYNSYRNYYFPETVKIISPYALYYQSYVDFYFTSIIPPESSGTMTTIGETNHCIAFVPYNTFNQYYERAGFSTTLEMKGWAPENTFVQNQILPLYNYEGYALNWYSDREFTIPVTTVADATKILYCTVGDTVLAHRIKRVDAINGIVTITDTQGNVYHKDDMIPENTVLTITGESAVNGYSLYNFIVNAQSFTSGDTYTMTKDLNISLIYWDGEHAPYDSVFANNDWATIKRAFQDNIAKDLWYVGDIKTITTTDDKTYQIRIADMQADRYDISFSDEKTHGVLEFVNCIKIGDDTLFKASSNINMGWKYVSLKKVLDTDFWNLLPSDLQDIIPEISLSEYAYSNASYGPVASISKLFLPAETELFDTASYSAEGQTGYTKYTQWDYYVPGRYKYKYVYGTQTNPVGWFTRSPRYNKSGNWCIVSSAGGKTYASSTSANGLSPCFAL